MKKLGLVSLVLVLMAGLIFGGCTKGTETESPTGEESPGPSVEEPIELSMVIFLPDMPPGNSWSHMFMDKVESISNGDITIDLIGGPEAIPASDQPAAVKRGTVDIANSMYNYAEALAPGVECLGRAEYTPAELRENGTVEYVQELFAESGVHYLGNSSPSEPHQQTAVYLGKGNKIEKVEDFQGLKIAATGGANAPFFEALGASCLPIPFGEYFTAMERGTADGYNVGVPGIQDYGLEPVTGYMLDELIASGAAAFLVNMDTWNSLSKDDQEVLTQAAIETEIDGIDVFEELVAEVKSDISDDGVEIIKLPPEESVEFFETYRQAMWAEDMEEYPEVTAELKEMATNPDFSRLQE